MDPASGTLLVGAVDLVLPGNAGFDLRVQRVYNSNVYPDYSSGGSTALEEDSWAGIGWKLHFGRILNPDSTVAGETKIEMGDGSRHPLYHSSANPFVWTTQDFWIYDRAAHTLKLPNGLIYTFDRFVFLNARLGTVRYVTEIKDPYNNRITFTYFNSSGPPDGVAAIDQYLDAAGTQVRHLTFTYDATLKALASMTYASGYLTHTWTYDHDPAGPSGYSVLRKVHPPVGPIWDYQYSPTMVGELTGLTTPAGGQLTYTYADALRKAGTLTTTTRVVTSRVTSGISVPVATWSYSYGTGSNHDTTVVTCPCGVQRFRFDGTGDTADFTGWRAGTLLEHTTEETNGTVRQRETNTWIRGEPISPDPLPGVSGVWADDAVYKPLLSQTVVTRGTPSWTTTFSYHTGLGNYNDYGRPWRTEAVESVYMKRTTDVTFRYGLTPYILDRIATTHSQVQFAFGAFSPAVDSSWTYETATGFLTAQTVNGFSTTFQKNAQGNVATVTDGRGKSTTYTYSWGRVSQQQAPPLTTTNVVQPDGLITSSSTGSLTTAYGYDAGFRLTSVTPPGGATVTTYTYNTPNARISRVTRGSAFTETEVDGFGRGVFTQDQHGVKATQGFDSCGRITVVSMPYTSGTPPNATVGYDALGRVTQTTNAAGDVTTFAYNGLNMTQTDGEGRQTTYTYNGFSGPGSGRLASVTDALGHVTSYEYDTLDGLTKVSGPLAGVVRTWTRDGAGQPLSDTQPESGTTTYQRDAVGNLTTLTDANGQVTTFTYDDNNRLLTRDAPGTADDLTLVYDDPATGLVKKLTGGAGTGTTTFTYDAAGRVYTRKDDFGSLSFTSSYLYNGTDTLTQIDYPSGRHVTYEYTALGRLSTIKQNAVVFANGFTYDGAGRPSGYTTGAVAHTFTYDPAGRTKTIVSSGSGGALDLTYSYDHAGNVTGIVDPRPGASQAFTMDPLDRLTQATGPWGTLAWTYDHAGNRLTETSGGITTYAYNASTQRLTSTSGAVNESFTYDAVGRLKSNSFGQYDYSPLGRLAQMTGTGVAGSYTYDPAGLRLAKTVNGATTYTVRSASGDSLSEYAASCGAPAWSRDLIYAGGRLIGAVKATTAIPTVSVSGTAVTASESTGSQSISFVLTTPGGTPLGCGVTATYQTTDGTAAGGADYTSKTGVLTFPAGTPNGTTQSVSVSLTNDTLDENDETFFVDVAGVTGGAVGTAARTTVTITDDDPLPAVSIANGSVPEGNTGATTLRFWVSLSATSGRTVTVPYATENRTAIAPTDYTAASGQVTFAPGTTLQPIDIAVVPDTIDEPDEVLAVRLSAPTNATLLRPIANGLILDDDGTAMHPPLDFNADGHPDFVWRHLVTGGDLALWYMNDMTLVSTPTMSPAALSDQTWEIRAVGDFNNDGHPDLVWRNTVTGEVAAWFYNGATRLSTSGFAFLNGTSTESQTAWTIVAAADLDRDGQLDLVWQNTSTGAVRIWHMSGLVQIDSVNLSLAPGDATWTVAGVADMNANGKPDIVWRQSTTGKLACWLMDDANVVQTVWLSPDINSDLNWRIAGVVDLNGDGSPDLLWQNVSNGYLAAWYVAGTVLSGTSPAPYLQVTDVNWRIVGVR